MSRDIRPDELIELAYQLAGRGAGPGRPRTVNLRRAISSAYYALFHELVHWAGRKAVWEATGRDTERWTLARWYQHADLRRVCGWFVAAGRGDRSLPAGVEVLLAGASKPAGVPAGLVDVAEAFEELYAARQRADYDHHYEVTRRHALDLVGNAATAIKAWRSLPDDYYSEVFLTLLGGPRPVRDRVG